MSEERKKVLEMLAEGAVSVEEAERLLDALGRQPEEGKKEGSPRYLRVQVEGGDAERVNVRVPFKLLRAGMKLGALIPGAAGEQVSGELKKHGIDLSRIDPDDLEDVIQSLEDLQVDVDGDQGEKVRVFCE